MSSTESLTHGIIHKPAEACTAAASSPWSLDHITVRPALCWLNSREGRLPSGLPGPQLQDGCKTLSLP